MDVGVTLVTIGVWLAVLLYLQMNLDYWLAAGLVAFGLIAIAVSFVSDARSKN
jgi:cell division protein FtsW (lipid II flippase)